MYRVGYKAQSIQRRPKISPKCNCAKISPQVTVKLVLDLVIIYVIQSHICSLSIHSTKCS